MSKQKVIVPDVNAAIYESIRKASSKVQEIPLPKTVDMNAFNKKMQNFQDDVAKRLAANLGK